MTDRQEAGDPVDRGAEVVAVAADGDADVDRHPHPEVGADRPRLRGQRPLTGDRRPRRRRRVVEHGVAGVADGLEDGPAGELDRVAEQLIVAGEGPGHVVRDRLPDRGRALDVGEQEGRVHGHVGHHPSLPGPRRQPVIRTGARWPTRRSAPYRLRRGSPLAGHGANEQTDPSSRRRARGRDDRSCPRRRRGGPRRRRRLRRSGRIRSRRGLPGPGRTCRRRRLPAGLPAAERHDPGADAGRVPRAGVGRAGPEPVGGRLRPQRRRAARPGRLRGAHAGRRRQLPGRRSHPPAVALVLGDGRRRRRRREPARLRGRDGQPSRDRSGERRRAGGDVAGHDRPGQPRCDLVRPGRRCRRRAVRVGRRRRRRAHLSVRPLLPPVHPRRDARPRRLVHVGGARRPRAARPPGGRARVPHRGRLVERPERGGGPVVRRRPHGQPGVGAALRRPLRGRLQGGRLVGDDDLRRHRADGHGAVDDGGHADALDEVRRLQHVLRVADAMASGRRRARRGAVEQRLGHARRRLRPARVVPHLVPRRRAADDAGRGAQGGRRDGGAGTSSDQARRGGYSHPR